ncbi:serine hydrolase domain-containing protein [Pacificimonas sp. ICDLI1SI03]
MAMTGNFNKGAGRASMAVLGKPRRNWALIGMTIALALLAVSMLSGFPGKAFWQDPVEAPSTTAVAPLPPADDEAQQELPQDSDTLTADDVEAWLDGMFPAALEQGKVAGAVISVVKDGEVLLSKGYGYADMETEAPMTGDRTLVRPGSTSKLFTWIAVMQQVEQGRIDLDADINTYLDFEIPERFDRPVTMNDLMTHTGGFEEGLKDAIVDKPEDYQTLDVFLKEHLRPMIFAPGKVPAYSNYGTAIAGYIVQRVSGEPFDDYVDRHIFTPLNMNRSTFVQPLPADIDAEMSKGYMSSDGPAKPFELISFGPAGSLTSTADDMANFMIALLQYGQFQDSQILQPQTMRRMYTPNRPMGEGFTDMAHGFFRATQNGRTILGHGGDTIVFHTDMNIVPEENVGLFVSFNSRGQGDAVYGIRQRLFSSFMDRYFPAPDEAADLPAIATARQHGQEVAGRYETSRRVESGFMSLFYVLIGQSDIILNPDDTISMASSPDTKYREVEPYLWREVGGTAMLKMEVVDGVKTIVSSDNPAGVLQPVPAHRNSNLNLFIFAVSVLILIGGVVAWIIAEGARRTYRQPPSLTGRPLLIRRLVRIATVLDLVYLGAWFAVIQPILGNNVAFYTAALDPVIRALQIAMIIPIFGAVVGVWNAVLSIRSGRSWIIKLGSILIAAALLGILWIAHIGGLMSLTLNY